MDSFDVGCGTLQVSVDFDGVTYEGFTFDFN
jgi:hypothetical protein